MKKRILSMLLAIVTVVAMIPAALIVAMAEATTPTPGYSDGYNIFVSDVEPTVDGVLDAVYEKSEAVVPNSYSGTLTANSFTAYSVITNKGIYFYVNVLDSTLDKSSDHGIDIGDKVQIYLQIANPDANGETKWAYDYIEMDYSKVVSKDDVSPMARIPYDLKNCKKQFARTKSANGYTVELLIEWENCASVFNGATITPETVDVYFGVQVNDYYVTTGSDGKTSTNNKRGVAYDNSSTSGYWVKTWDVGSNGQNYVLDENKNYVYENGQKKIVGEITKAYNSLNGAKPISIMNPTNLFKTTGGAYYGYDVYISNTEPDYTDGVRDSIYTKSEKIVQTHYADNAKTAVSYEAYAVVTQSGFYLFADVKDTTLDDAYSTVNWADKLQLFMQVANTNSSGVKEWAFGYFEMDYSHSNVNRSDNFSNAEYFVSSKTTNGVGYSIEFYMPWNNCASIFSGDVITTETVEVYFGVQVNNSQLNHGDGNTELGVAYDVKACADYWHRTTAKDKEGNLINYATNYDAPSGKEPQNKMVAAKFFTEGTLAYTDGYDTIVAAPKEIKLDGEMDAIYLESEKIAPNYYYTRNGIRLTDIDFEVYPVVTEKGIYIWAEVTDSSLNASREIAANKYYNDTMRLYLQFFSNENETGRVYKWGFVDFDYANNEVTGNQYFSLPYYPNCTPELKTNTTTEGWTAEFFMSWNEAGIATNDLNDISVYIGVQAHNGDAGGNPNYGWAYDNPEAVNYSLGNDKEGGYGPDRVGDKRYIKLNYVYTGNQPLDSGVASIPAFSVYQLGTGATVSVDGIRDDVYTKSQKIEEKAVVGSGTGFDAYFVASTEGIYFYAEVEDPTAGKADDKIRLYLTDDPNQHAKPKDKVANSKYATQTFTYLEISAANTKSGKGFTNINNVNTKTKKLINDSGKAYAWTVEAFIPWGSMENYAEEIADTTLNAPYYCSVGISAHNDDNVSYSNERRYDWAELQKAHDYVEPYSVSENNDSKKSCYYVPLTYSKYDLDVRNVYVTESEKNIKLDGVPEDVYKNSSKAYKKDQHGSGDAIQFNSYSVATLDGLYVWVITNDSTLDNINDYDAETGDMIQIYFDWTLNYRSHDVNGYTGSAYKESYAYFCGGWFCFDYEGNIKQSLFKEAATLGQVDFKVIRSDNTADAANWSKANSETEYASGYALEVFIPWNDEMRDQIGSRANDIHMGLGIQVSDDNQRDDTDFRKGIAYCASQTNETRFYYNNYEALPDVNFIYESTLPEYSRFVIDKVDAGKSVVIDGSNTDGEYDDALIIRANLEGRGTADDGDIIRIVYDEKAIYMLIEVEDNTPSYDYNKFGKYSDYVDLAIVFDNKYTTMTTFYRSDKGVDLINDNYHQTLEDKSKVFRYGTAGHPTVAATGLRWYNYDAALDHFIDIDKSNEESKTVYNSDYIACTNTSYNWSYEIAIPLTDEEYKKIQSGEFVFGVGAQYLDSYDTDGNYNEDNERNYKYTVKNSGIYTGDNAMNEDYHENTATHPSELYKYSYFKFENVNESTVAGADVSLGDSITLNFYVNAPEGADSVMAEIEMNNQIVLIEGELAINTCGDNYMRQYVISFSGIAPQCVGDNINAKFYVDGKLIKTATEKLEEVNYSVLEYCKNVLGRTYSENKLKNEDQNIKLKSLVYDFLHYCAAAQNYVGYKTKELVNTGYANNHDSNAAAPVNDDKKIGTATIDGAKFSALGIYHYSTNKIYAKVTVDTSKVDVAKLKVYINDSKGEAKMELSSQNGNEAVYIIYSDGIKVTGFDRVYKFVLTNGSQQQTLYYSINAYCNAKWGSTTPKVKNLARTLYYYGIAAEAYQASLLNS